MIDQAVMDSVEREFKAVGDTELIENVVEMILDGLLGDEKLFTDLLVAETLSHQLYDFFFAVTEQRFLAARPGFGGFREGLHDFRGHAIVEPDFAGVHTMNAL